MIRRCDSVTKSVTKSMFRDMSQTRHKVSQTKLNTVTNCHARCCDVTEGVYIYTPLSQTPVTKNI